jgi:hypothetical protein
VVRVLLAEEAAGRDVATIRARRRRAGFPAGKTFGAWDQTVSSIPRPTQQALRTLEWVTRRENVCICGPSGTGTSHFVEALGQQAIDQGMTVAWFSIEDLGALVRRHRADDTVAKAIKRITSVDLVAVDDIGMLPSAPTPPRASTGWSMPPTSAAPWRSQATCTRPDSTSSCPRPWPPPPSTGCCTTPTSWSPKATRSAWPRRPPARG